MTKDLCRADRGEHVARGGIEPERPTLRYLSTAALRGGAAERCGLVADGHRQTWATIRSGLSAGLQQAVDLDTDRRKLRQGPVVGGETPDGFAHAAV